MSNNPRLDDNDRKHIRELWKSVLKRIHAIPAENTNPGCGCSHHPAENTPQEAHACACGQAHQGEHSCKCKGLMTYRKFHSAAGVVFGIFLIIHAVISACALSPAKFNQNSAAMRTLRDNLPFVEWFLVYLPMLIITSTGGYLLYKHGARYNVKKCNRGGKLRFFLQRVSAIGIGAFLLVHLFSFGRLAIKEGFDPEQPFASTRHALHALPMLHIVYLLGIAGVCYHVCNGLFTAAHAWGVMGDPIREKRWNTICAVLFVMLLTLGITAWFAFI